MNRRVSLRPAHTSLYQQLVTFLNAKARGVCSNQSDNRNGLALHKVQSDEGQAAFIPFCWHVGYEFNLLALSRWILGRPMKILHVLLTHYTQWASHVETLIASVWSTCEINGFIEMRSIVKLNTVIISLPVFSIYVSHSAFTLAGQNVHVCVGFCFFFLPVSECSFPLFPFCIFVSRSEPQREACSQRQCWSSLSLELAATWTEMNGKLFDHRDPETFSERGVSAQAPKDERQAVKHTFIAANTCNYIVVWCSRAQKKTSSNGTILLRKQIVTASTKWTCFTILIWVIGPITFGTSRGDFNPIEISRC